MKKKPLMLIILDGLGIGKDYEGNAFFRAKTPVIDRIIKSHPYSELEASGQYVGLPEGQMGNSEVGHLNIGAGRIVYQELTRIGKSIEDRSFFEKEEFLKAIESARKNGSKIHLMGLFSSGGVHSHKTHLYALLELMKIEGFEDVVVHPILDGRDVSPNAGLKDLEELEEKINELGIGRIASISGRYYAMDRDNRWDRIELAYDAYVHGEGERSKDPIQAIRDAYEQGLGDEFIVPTVIEEGGEAVARIEDGDSLIFFNFRPDRARQITRSFVDKDFRGFEREKLDLHYVSMTEYDESIEGVEVVFKPENLEDILGELISRQGLKQLRAAETEKYAHVTFFFNGGREKPFPGEDRLLIDSPKVATYDLEPEMSALKLKDAILEKLDEDLYDLIILNFANCDMVGHTGKIDASIRAVETVDLALGEILDSLDDKGGRALITADHGNVERLLDDEGNPVTSHTTNRVPLIYFNGEEELRSGKLSDLAVTILEILDIEKPDLMTGESLIER